MIRTCWYACTLLTAVFLLSSCGVKSNQVQYVAAKLVDSDMWSIVDVQNGQVIYKDEFKSQPSEIINNKFCVKNESGLYDYFTIDNVTKPINSESYLCATSFNENDVALVVLPGKGISVINGQCEIIANVDNAIVKSWDYSNGFAVVFTDDGKKGYINEKGEIIISPDYDSATSFSKDGIAVVGKEVSEVTSKYSAIDVKGEKLFSFSSSEYKAYGSFINGYLPVKKVNDEVVLLDKAGNKYLNLGKWDSYIPGWLGFNDGVIVFKSGEAYGLKNEKGEIVIRAKYDELVPCPQVDNKYYLAKKQDKYGIVDKNDNVIVPFDYTILTYINKDILIAGDGKNFSFMDQNLKDIGQENFTNISFWAGPLVLSNYFDADKEARKIVSKISDTTFFHTHKGMLLRDFADKLSGYKYSDMDKCTIDEFDYPFSYLYAFDRNLASERYEYIYGYRFPTSPEYNYSANLGLVAAINITYSEYQTGAEEDLVKAFETQIQKKGFKPVDEYPHWFTNDNGMAVAMSYDKSIVGVYCAFIPRFMKYEVKRIPRDGSEKDEEVDYIDTFGIDKNPNPVEEVELVEEVASSK